MARPQLLPDVETLRTHRLEDKMTYREIAEKYGVTVSAVQKKLSGGGAVRKLVTYKDVVPWEIPPEYHNTAMMDRIRSIAKQKQGVPLDPDAQARLDRWLSDMADSMVVLDFHPDAPPNDACSLGGFHYRTRVPEDQHFYRDPAINVKLAALKKAAIKAGTWGV